MQKTTRRGFLKVASTCAAHLALMATPFPASARLLWSRRKLSTIAAQESFGRLEMVGEGLWALVSTPLGGDYTTVSNGGIIAGGDGVLVVEAFQTPEGARWMAEKARELTGRWPTHVLVTHYHGDHTNGAEGFQQNPERPVVHATGTTRDLRAAGLPGEASEMLRKLWADVALVPEEGHHTIDLGGRTVELIPRTGHTPSDVTVDLPDEGVTWCGDLVWNGMFPNYMDAVPSRLSAAVRNLQATRRRIYVPGHGPLADSNDFTRYVEVIDGLEATARTARREGWTSEEAGARHRIPEQLGEWTLFNPSYFQRAVEAWMKEWDAVG
jgi:glyoxylase-like metal-dependent hydrolase (beta-lactamase superfamily II)